ncbi:MAG: hypothetical protein CMJ34_08550 [Phycisphaerae bacterium]|nr:hypothetical protein [Phycisphaerae bacterium]
MTLIHTPDRTPYEDAEAASGGSADPGSFGGGLVGDWGAIDPLILAAVAATGVLLLLFGGRILRPAVVLGAASLGALVGLRLAAASRAELLPAIIQGLGIPPVVWVILLPLLGGLIAAVLVRLALAVLLGIAVATLVLVLGLAVAGGGGVDSPGAGSTVSLTWRTSQEAPPGWSDQMTDQVTDQVADQVGETMRDRLGEMAEGLVGDLPDLDPGIPEGFQRWWRDMTATVPPGTIDLVMALATVCGICALLLGLLLPQRVAIAGTAIAGAWLMAAAATGAWARFGDGAPPPIVPSIIGVAVLAVGGIIFQARTRPKVSVVGRRRLRR